MLLDLPRLVLPRNGRLTLAASLAFSGVVGYLLASWVIQPRISPATFSHKDVHQVKTLLVTSKANLDLGTIQKGGYREACFSLENLGSQTVEIGTIATSCECFEVILERRIVAAGEKIKATAKVDLTDDLLFAGSLDLWAEGKVTEQDVLAFVIKAKVTVRGPREHLTK
jgi:hypothetical protein